MRADCLHDLHAYVVVDRITFTSYRGSWLRLCGLAVGGCDTFNRMTTVEMVCKAAGAQHHAKKNILQRWAQCEGLKCCFQTQQCGDDAHRQKEIGNLVI